MWKRKYKKLEQNAYISVCFVLVCKSTMKSSQLLSAFLQRHVERRQVEEGLEESLRYQQMAVPLDNRIVRHKHKRNRKTGKGLTMRQLKQSKLLKIEKQDVM